MEKPLVGIIMGSDSDLELMQEAAQVLEEFGVPFEINIVSAHRTPDRMAEYGRSAAGRGLKTIIACTGGAAHLPGMVASYTSLPVIGVPRKLKSLDGLDSLLSMVQMPGGIPVATVAIDGAKNAGLLAVRIVGATDESFQAKMEEYQKSLTDTITQKGEKLKSVGYKQYLEEANLPR
jgi:5-(carboxyamino)imidazole ribonucleotide mutase